MLAVNALGQSCEHMLATYVCLCMSIMTYAILADTLIANGVGVKKVRRQLQVVSMVGPAACLVIAASPLCAGSASAASASVTVGLGLSALSLGMQLCMLLEY